MGWILFNSLSFLLPTIFLINNPIMKIPRSLHLPFDYSYGCKIFNKSDITSSSLIQNANSLWVKVRKPALYHIRFRASLVCGEGVRAKDSKTNDIAH